MRELSGYPNSRGVTAVSVYKIDETLNISAPSHYIPDPTLFDSRTDSAVSLCEPDSAAIDSNGAVPYEGGGEGEDLLQQESQ